MTSKMKAVVLTSPGTPEALQLQQVTMPQLTSSHDVLVRLNSAALNPADAYFRAYGPYLDTGGPCILGHDGAGVVEQIGSDVSRVEPGQRVCFCNGGIGGGFGTYAEYAVVRETQLSVIPDSIDNATAAALPLVFITAWESLHDRAQVSAGEFVLIHAGAGGTGHVSVQLAAMLGARVASTVSNDAKIELVRQLGVERAIAYRREDFVEAAREWTSAQGVDVALDNLGAETFQETIGAMAPYGRLVTLMGMPADDAEETAYINNLTIHNVMMLTPMILKMQARLDRQAEIVARGLQLLEQGKLKLVIERQFALEEIAAAHEMLDAGKTTGKIVIAIGD
jgi:NADPH2:quinone reductase